MSGYQDDFTASYLSDKWETNLDPPRPLSIGAKLGIAIAVAIVVAGIIAGLVIWLAPKQSDDPQPTPTPTPTPTITIIPPNPQLVAITTTIDEEVGCIAFDANQTLQFGNCGSPQIQSTWVYDDIYMQLTNFLQQTSRTNCMINPDNITNPTVKGQSVTTTNVSCLGIKLGPNRIETSNGQFYIAVVAGSLIWTSDPQFAQEFHFET